MKRLSCPARRDRIIPLDRRGHGRLAEGEAAVVGWDAAVDQDLEPLIAEPVGRPAQQEHVLEDTAAQSDRADPGVVPRPAGQLDDRPGHRMVEPARQHRPRHPAPEFGRDRAEHGGGVDHDGTVRLGDLEGERATGPLVSLVAPRLHLDGGLGLVRDRLPDADQRGHGVEETAHAAGGDAVQAPLELPAQDPALGLGAGRHAGQVVVPGQAGRPEVGQGRAVGAADGGVAAGQRDVFQVGQAAEPPVIGQQDLAPQIAPSRP